MSTVNMRIRKDIHSQIKNIAEKEDKGVQEMTEELLLYSLKKYYSDEVMRYTDIERILNNRIGKVEEQLNKCTERLASLMARIGIDNAMGLMGDIVLLEKLLKLNRKDIQNELRKQGAIYFSTAVKEDKEEKKKEAAKEDN
jgi:H2-forming N5,N10-methylenetetrahydromethanopterin dehydrogenase-like enzyme